jgi:hypothetical protein
MKIRPLFFSTFADHSLSTSGASLEKRGLRLRFRAVSCGVALYGYLMTFEAAKNTGLIKPER